MHFRRIRYRYAVLAPNLEPRPLGDVFRTRPPGSLAQAHWRPLADLYEGPDALFVKIELSGVGDDEVEVALYEDTLVVEGERPWRLPEGVVRFHAVEIPYGPFRVEVAVPEGLDRESLEAHFERGVLLVRLPKQRGAQ